MWSWKRFLPAATAVNKTLSTTARTSRQLNMAIPARYLRVKFEEIKADQNATAPVTKRIFDFMGTPLSEEMRWRWGWQMTKDVTNESILNALGLPLIH